jgi:hypothetical protein
LNTSLYLDTFQKAADLLDKEYLNKNKIEVSVGTVLDSVFLKLYKKSWTSSLQDPLNAESRIFFSVWVNDSTLQSDKIFYNIHALKLRKLSSYAIESRKFANTFRIDFQKYSHQWPNVSTAFGPLTLMEGNVNLDSEKIEKDILILSNNFLAIAHLIDQSLLKFKK